MEINVKAWPKWLIFQLGQLVLAAGILSLIFNYAWRFAVDPNANSSAFYILTVAFGLVAFVLLRRDYVLTFRYVFSSTEIRVYTVFGVRKTYVLDVYAFVPCLHKTINWPEQSATLSFYVRDKRTGRDVRHYPWTGFSASDFREVSKFYGYRGEADFKQKDFGRQR